MTSQAARTVLEDLERHCQVICEIARMAKKHNKSLGGQNPYGKRFHDAVVALSRVESKLGSILTAAELEGDGAGTLSALLDSLKSSKTDSHQRCEILKQVQLLCQASILPAIERLSANPIPETEQVLPLDLVRSTRRTYIEKVIVQANGCYEHGWYDACSVMVRRLVETLIIELYEAKGKEAEIKNPAGDYFMLSVLVDASLANNAWNLSRETKRALPELKSVGDRAAHSRHYFARRQDVDKVIPGLRIVAEELLHLAGLL
jgi:hypothetical protein